MQKYGIDSEDQVKARLNRKYTMGLNHCWEVSYAQFKEENVQGLQKMANNAADIKDSIIALFVVVHVLIYRIQV
jgi:hypothetical protein